MPLVLIQGESPVGVVETDRLRRILMIVHGYPPHQTSGGEVHAQRKAQWWHARGHQVAVIAADPQPAARLPFGQLEERVDDVDGIAVRRVRLAIPDATRPLAETYRHPLLTEVLEREIARFRPDLVYLVSGYIFGLVPVEVAARLGIPVVLFAVDFWSVCQRITLLRPDGTCCPGPTSPADCAACRLTDRTSAHRLGPAANRLGWRALAAVGKVAPVGPVAAALGVTDFVERQATITESLRHVALVIVNSRFLAGWMEHLGVPSDRLLYKRQGIVDDEFLAEPVRVTGSASGLRLLYLGQVSGHKGADLAVEAVARLRAANLPVQLRMHGPLTDRTGYLAQLTARIAAINAAYGESIQIGPSLARSQLSSLLSSTDALLVPSRWYDNSPNVILEAFAMGVPVIAAGHGGMAEMVRDGVDGLLFQPGDARSLAGAIRSLALAPALLARLRAGIRRPHDLDEEMMVEEAALDQICSRARLPR